MEPLVRHAMVRYADDFVLLARTKNDAQNLLEIVKNTVEILGLKLSEEKTHITSVKDGFDFLGEHFDRQTFENTAIPSNTGQRKPLLITESFLQIGLNGGAIDIRRNREIIDTIPLRRISEMVVLGKNNLSTALMQRLAEHKIPLSIALNGGYQMAVLTPDSRQFHETTWMQSRRYYAMTDTERLSVAYALVSAKLKGYTALVRKRNPICADTLRVIAQAQNALNTCTTVQELRGYEGYAAKACFAWLQKQLKPEVQSSFIALRRERGAGDRLNSMLNFGYYLSYTRLNGLVRASGLNPYLGFLHDGLDDYETLVADLQELVRPFVDRLIIQLVNMGYIRPNSFEKTERGLYLTKEATRTMAMEFERMMGQKIINQRLGDMLVTQIRHIRAFLCQGQSLWLFHFGMDEYPTSSTVPESDLENDDEESDESTSSWSTLTNERTT
jgi:CRISPR-associated protein Cas1